MSNIKKSLNLGSKIKSARKGAGLSQKEMAKILGISDKAVSSYEVGRATPPVPTLREISTITYKPYSYFMEPDESEEMDVPGKIAKIEHELSEIKRMLAMQQLHQIEQTQLTDSDQDKGS